MNNLQKNRALWITLFGALAELPAEEVSEGFGVPLMHACKMKVAAEEYVVLHNRAIAPALRLVSSDDEGGAA